MREALHQLTMALALPLAVTAVWVVRGNPASGEAAEAATAYRAELAALPLPRSERLRAPHEAIDWRRAPRQTEEPITPRRRATLPDPTPAPVVALAPAGDSEGELGRFAAPLVAEPELQPMFDPNPSASRAAQPPAVTLSAVAPSASALAPLAASAAGASEASAESQPEPGAKPAPLAAETPSSGAKPVARAIDEVVRPSQAAPPAKLDVAANVPTRIAVKPIATAPVKPAPAAPSIAATPAAPARTHPEKPLPATTPARSTPSTQPYEAPAKTPQGRGELATIEEQWREYIVAPAATPVVAPATREPGEAVDVWLGGSGQPTGSLLDEVLPTVHAWTAPPELAPAKPAPAGGAPSVPDSLSLPGLVDLPLQALTALAAGVDDGAAGADRADFANERSFPPLQTLFMIPEPASATLIGVALATLAATRRRQRRR